MFELTNDVESFFDFDNSMITEQPDQDHFMNQWVFPHVQNPESLAS